MRFKECLNGLWDFAPAEKLTALPTAYDAVPIQVPSPFNVNSFAHGYGKHTAGESYFVEGGDFRLYPDYPVEWDTLHAGWYRRMLRIPADAAGQRVFLRFDAVAYHSVYYLDGQQVGEEHEAFLPIELEITAFVTPGGEHELLVGCETAARVMYTDEEGKRRTDFPKGSFWGDHAGGIWQDAWLELRPAAHVADVFAVTDTDANTLRVRYEVAGAAADAAVRFSLSKWGDSAPARTLPGTGKDGTFTWTYADGDVDLWDIDAPHLYMLTATLYDGESAGDEYTVRIGFRTFTTEGDHFRLNGRPIRLTNDSWHYLGYSIQTPAYARAYYAMARDANVNSIRLHAQPFPGFFYDIADEEGMLLVSESAVWASHCNFSYSPAFFENSKQHLRRLILRDRNHPSVIMWSPENECIPAYKVCGSQYVTGVADLEDKLYDLTQEIPPLDDSRIISCDGSGDLGGRMRVNSLHYPGYGCPTHREKPITIGEMGSMYFSTPDNVTLHEGQYPLYSFDGRLTAVGKDAYHNLIGQRKWAAQVCVFNLIWYGLQPLPFREQLISHPDLTLPGIKPGRITPYLRTLNAGAQKNLPDYIANPVWKLTKSAFTPIRFFVENAPSAVFAGEELAVPLVLFNHGRTDGTFSIQTLVHSENTGRAEPARIYHIPACGHAEDVLRIQMPADGEKMTLRLVLFRDDPDMGRAEELHAETLIIDLFDRKKLAQEWAALGVTELCAGDADVSDKTLPVLDYRPGAPYDGFTRSMSVRELFAADGESVTLNAAHDGRYFEEYLNFNAAPVWFNGAGNALALDLAQAGERRILCGLDLAALADEPYAWLLRIRLGKALLASAPAVPGTAVFYGDPAGRTAAMLDEVRCAYEAVDKEELLKRLRSKQTGPLLVEGGRDLDWLKSVGAHNFAKVLLLELDKTPALFAYDFEVSGRRAYQLMPVHLDPLNRGLYGNTLYGLGAGREEALANNLLRYRQGSEHILLGVPDIDWRMWNHNAEYLKTVAVHRGAQADNSALAALACHGHAGSDIYVSQLALDPQSKKSRGIFVRLLSALGVGVELAQTGALEELLYGGVYGVQVNRMLVKSLEDGETAETLNPGLNRVQSGTAWRVTSGGGIPGRAALAVFVYSPQDRTDLLLNPDTVDLDVEAAAGVTLYLNGTEQGGGETFTVTSITLEAGWNTLLLTGEGLSALPRLHFRRTNLKKLDLRFGLYDAELKPLALQKATLRSDDRPDGVERAIMGREQHWRASEDQRAGIDFGVEFPQAVTARAISFSGVVSDFVRDRFTPYCWRLLAGDSADALTEVYRSVFEDKMAYPGGRVFVRLDDVTASHFRLELTHNALKPWTVAELTILA